MAVRRQASVRTGTPTRFGRAAIYARISLDKVGEAAAGIGRQIDACRHLADLEGWSIDEVLVDNDLSAYSGACRPEYRARRPQHGASARFTAQVLGAAAEHESARIGERVSAKHRQNA